MAENEIFSQKVKVLSLESIIKSKKSLAREEKDKLVIPALESTLLARKD